MSATILCYHKVAAASEEQRRLNIEPSRLRSHVGFFSRKQRPFLTAGALADRIPEGSVCFTFDDAYRCTMENAPIIFEEFGVRASFYAVPSLVGGNSEWDGPAARPLAGWDVLVATQARGHEIGNHSMTHPKMAELPVVAQVHEVVASQQAMADHGLRPQSFCYPYGSCDAKTAEVIRRAGYRVGLALGKRPTRAGDDMLRLPRVVVAYSDALPMLLYKIVLKPRLRRV